LIVEEGRARIEQELCRGCTLCAQICGLGAVGKAITNDEL